MLALTLWQPWAWSILHLPESVAKPVENRDWMPPASVVGTRIALHGGKRYDGEAAWTIARHAGACLPMPRGTPSDRASGILGTVRLVGVIERQRGRLELVAGDWGDVTRERATPWFVGRYGWLVDERRVLDVPIPCRGLQKLWTVPDELVARLAA